MFFENKTYDEERALYGLKNAKVLSCRFEGPADGESAFKECNDIEVDKCFFALRYPFWHVTDAKISDCEMTETCRAALWYDKNVEIKSSVLGGIKALRECDDIVLSGCKIESEEFAWKVRNFRITDCELKSQYPFFECRDMDIEKLSMTGKYSFQYVENVVIRNSVLKTKDAFWHAKNVTCIDCVIEGEYLAWYSENLRLVNCTIRGTQPRCYCRGLVLENCKMENTDLSFERSEVEATVNGNIISVKNPINGFIKAGSIDEIIIEDEFKGLCAIETK